MLQELRGRLLRQAKFQHLDFITRLLGAGNGRSLDPKP
jgi:hypothetical protein